MRIGDLIEERAKLIERMRGILDKAEAEKRDLTAEERQEYDRMETRVTELSGDIRRMEQQRRLEELSPLVEGRDDEPQEARVVDRSSEEYRAALEAYARGRELTAEERSTLNVGTDGEGGFAVPEAWTELYEALREFGVIRGLAEVITTEGGGSLHVPRVAADATAPGIVDEEDDIPDDAETFGEVVLGAYKYARITKASEEFVQDALFDVAAFVGRRLGQDLALATGADYAVGSGTGEPQGLFTGASLAFELADNGAITADEIIDLFYSVIAPYRQNGVWICNDRTVAAIRKLKGTDGHYLWQPALSAGAPDTLLGKPIYTDPHVPTLGSAADSRVIGFGNVRRAYTIRDVLGVTIKFLDQTFAAKDQVAWRGKLRTDAAVVDANAFKVVDLPAAP